MIGAFVDVGGRKIDKAEDTKELYMDPQNHLPLLVPKSLLLMANRAPFWNQQKRISNLKTSLHQVHQLWATCLGRRIFTVPQKWA